MYTKYLCLVFKYRLADVEPIVLLSIKFQNKVCLQISDNPHKYDKIIDKIIDSCQGRTY